MPKARKSKSEIERKSFSNFFRLFLGRFWDFSLFFVGWRQFFWLAGLGKCWGDLRVGCFLEGVSGLGNLDLAMGVLERDRDDLVATNKRGRCRERWADLGSMFTHKGGSLHGVGGEPEEEEKSADVGEGGEEDAGGQGGVDAHPFEG